MDEATFRRAVDAVVALQSYWAGYEPSIDIGDPEDAEVVVRTVLDAIGVSAP